METSTQLIITPEVLRTIQSYIEFKPYIPSNDAPESEWDMLCKKAEESEKGKELLDVIGRIMMQSIGKHLLERENAKLTLTVS